VSRTDETPADESSGSTPTDTDGSDATTPLTGETNVAIACQGGGSHTAFAAGVLERLFEAWPAGYRLVGLSGTSGGAINALAAWYGLLAEEHTPGDRLRAVWDEITAHGVFNRGVNDWLVAGSRASSSGLPIPEFSPYQTPAAGWGRRYLERAVEAAVDFDRVPELDGPAAPKLLVGTVDVNGGEFETFTNGDVTMDAVLASTAVPDLFEAVEIDGHWHWDGLFSQNPPIHELMRLGRDRKPEQLWVVQINPQEREGEPTSLPEIKDRRNELAGNISLNQELRFIRRVNDWVEAGHLPDDQFTHTEIHTVSMDRALHSTSKLDRSPEFIRELTDLGHRRADALLAELE
jgi:NTE family protein